MNTILLKVIGIVIALSIAFGAGFYTEAQFVKAERAAAAEAALKDAAKSIAASNESSKKIEAKVRKTNSDIERIANVVTEHVIEKEKEDETKCEPAALRLDVFTVRMLNSARSENAQPTSIGDAEGQAPSTIGFPELVADDLEVTKLYKELATRHDALVDYVQSEIDKQAK